MLSRFIQILFSAGKIIAGTKPQTKKNHSMKIKKAWLFLKLSHFSLTVQANEKRSNFSNYPGFFLRSSSHSYISLAREREMYICWLDSCRVPRKKYKNPMEDTKIFHRRGWFKGHFETFELASPGENFCTLQRIFYFLGTRQLSNQQIYI